MLTSGAPASFLNLYMSFIKKALYHCLKPTTPIERDIGVLLVFDQYGALVGSPNSDLQPDEERKARSAPEERVFLLHCLKMCIIHVAIGGLAKRDCRKSFVRKAVP